MKGFTNNKFASVKEVFKQNFTHHDELGARFCVYHKNECVVDLWDGYSDKGKTKEWSDDTLVPIFSTTKAVSAACLAICHSRGLFQYTDKVVKYWPEFGANGKNDITIQQLLQHQAGLAALDVKIDIELAKNEKRLDAYLANQKPLWVPGEYQGYHAWTIGWYISALLSRIDPNNRRIRQFVIEELNPHFSDPLFIGIPESEKNLNIASLIPFSKMKGLFSMPFKFVIEFFKPKSITSRSMLNPVFAKNHANFNRMEILQLELGSGGGVANAKSLAQTLNGLIDSKCPFHLNQHTLEHLFEQPSTPLKGFEDLVFKQEVFRFNYGFMKPCDSHDFSPSSNAFAGFGAGGSFVIVDPENELTLAYTPNRMGHAIKDDIREVNLRNKIYDILLS